MMEVNCSQCKKIIKKKLSDIKKSKNLFCDYECHNLFQRNGKTSKRKCHCCKKFFDAKKPSSKTIYCSRECYEANRDSTIIFKCFNCKISFEKKQYQVKSKNKDKYCSPDCYIQTKYKQKNKRIKNRKCERCGKLSYVKTGKFCKKCRYPSKNKKSLKCIECEKLVTVPNGIYNFKIKTKTKITCSDKCKNSHHSKKMSLNGNPNWNGGSSFEPYPKEWNKNFKIKVREIDKNICQICNRNQSNYHMTFHVHHIDHDKKNLKIQNLITLCPPCHIGTVHRDKSWNLKKLLQLQKKAASKARCSILK